ncbi:hypothetical protein [Citrobacter telavivensis]|uniref:hypothetical protein n=1 Tax=Citrobacter telavivensis TaxID=2653932 RepID=UPI00359EF989
MIDIAEALQARKNEFISLRELITRIHLHQPHVSLNDIAEYIYFENSNRELGEWVQKGIAGSIETTYVDDESYEETDTSLESLLQVVRTEGKMPEVSPPRLEYPLPSLQTPLEPPMDFDDDIPF